MQQNTAALRVYRRFVKKSTMANQDNALTQPEIPENLRIQPNQRDLRPEQVIAAQQVGLEYIEALFSTAPVNEAEAQELLGAVYRLANLEPPKRIIWLDSPLALVLLQIDSCARAILGNSVADAMWASVAPRIRDQAMRTGLMGTSEGAESDNARTSRNDKANSALWASLWADHWNGAPGASTDWDHLWGHNHWVDPVGRRISERVVAPVEKRIHDDLWRNIARPMTAHIGDSVLSGLAVGLDTSLSENVWACVKGNVFAGVSASVWGMVSRRIDISKFASLRTTQSIYQFAVYYFLDMYDVPSGLKTLFRFNNMVAGYWLNTDAAFVVRKPHSITRDEQGRLHNSSGLCVEFPDGWGLYYWHGTRANEKIILQPETLTRADFLNENNLEVRRIIQERMGERFVAELGGKIIDSEPMRGILYEVELPNDPEGVAHYVKVKDASTSREYYLRVPPTVQTAQEAVAWTFELEAWSYMPSEEA